MEHRRPWNIIEAHKTSQKSPRQLIPFVDHHPRDLWWLWCRSQVSLASIRGGDGLESGLHGWLFTFLTFPNRQKCYSWGVSLCVCASLSDIRYHLRFGAFFLLRKKEKARIWASFHYTQNLVQHQNFTASQCLGNRKTSACVPLFPGWGISVTCPCLLIEIIHLQTCQVLERLRRNSCSQKSIDWNRLKQASI